MKKKNEERERENNSKEEKRHDGCARVRCEMRENSNAHTHTHSIAIFTMKLCRMSADFKVGIQRFFLSSFYSLNLVDRCHFFRQFWCSCCCFLSSFLHFFLNDPRAHTRSLSNTHCCDTIEIKFKLYRLKANQRHNISNSSRRKRKRRRSSIR